jgi:phage terminase small subunit
VTPLQERFVFEYLKDQNGTRAYLRAKPGVKETTARTEASKLLAKPNVAVAVQAQRARLVEKMELTSERVLREVARLAFFDPRKLLDSKGNPLPIEDDDTAAAVAGVEVLKINLGTAIAGPLVGKRWLTGRTRSKREGPAMFRIAKVGGMRRRLAHPQIP